LKKIKILPKQQSTSFWSQGILGVKFSLLDFSLVDFLATPIFFKAKGGGGTENVVRAYTILEIMSIQGYKMWTNGLRTQEIVCNQ
jgi:hypothetical protein